MNFWPQAFHLQVWASSAGAEDDEVAWEALDVALEGAGVVDLESLLLALLAPDDCCGCCCCAGSGTGGDMAENQLGRWPTSGFA